MTIEDVIRIHVKDEILKKFGEKIQKWFLYDYIFAGSSQIWSSQRIFFQNQNNNKN